MTEPLGCRGARPGARTLSARAPVRHGPRSPVRSSAATPTVLRGPPTEEPTDDLLEERGELVAEAHDRLGHELGWQLLLSPARTLDEATRLALVGLNPGGDHALPPQLSTEAGNAYRVEGWAPDGTPNRLQQQVTTLFELLAARLGEGASAAELMDGTLTTSFCPFRSPDWQRLAARDESVEVARELWDELLTHVWPSVFVCLGELAATEIGAALQRAGALRSGTSTAPVHWGKATYTETLYRADRGDVLVVRLPSLTRFSIFGREASQDVVDVLVEDIAATLERADAA